MKTKSVLLLSTLATAALLLVAVFVFLTAFSLTTGLTLAAPPDAPGPVSVATTVGLAPLGLSRVTLTRSPTSVLADGTSTITPTVKDEVDSFSNGSPPLSASAVYTVEAESSAVTKVGTWSTWIEGECDASNGQVIYSGNTNDKVSYTFTGSEVTVLYQKQWNTGFMDVRVDGSLQQRVDTYCCAPPALPPNKQCRQAVVVSNLPWGPHTVEAVVVGDKNPLSSGNSIVVDAFIVTTDISTGCEDVYEPDNDFTTAVTVTVPGFTSHNFDFAGDQDWVKFWAEEGITYTIETMNLAISGTQTVDTELGLYWWDDPDLVELATDKDSGSENRAALIVWPITTTGWYYVNVGRAEAEWSFSGCDAYYSLRISGPPAEVYLPIILKNDPPGPPCCPMVEDTVGVGDMPWGLAISTATNRIYVANHDDDSISVIDGSTNTVVGTIDLAGYGSGPNGIAYHPSGLLYVSLAGSDKVAIINASTGAVMGTVNVGDNPAGVAVNPVSGRVYVANFGGASTATDTVSVISGTTVVGTIGVGDAPSQIAVNPNTNRIFVTNHGHGTNYGEEGSSVSVINGSTGAVIKTIPLVTGLPPTPGQGPHGIAVNPNTNKIYVAVVDSHRLVVIDGNNLDAPPTYVAPSPDVPIWLVAVNPDLNRVYAVGCDEVRINKVFVLDGATNTWLPCDVDVGARPKQGVAFNPETGRLYVSNEGSDGVTVIWTCSASEPPPSPGPPSPPPPPPPGPGGCYPRVVTSITVGNDPRGVAYNDDDNLIYVANNGDGTVSVINGVTYGVTKVITGVTGANGVAYDSEHRLVYVTNQSVDRLTVISATAHTIVKTIPVGDQPHGVAYNPTSHKIYVANYRGNSATIINADTMTTTATISGLNEPAHIAVNPVTNKVYVSNHGNGKVTVIRGAYDDVRTTVSLGSSGPYGIAADTWRNLIYVVSITVPDGDAPNLVTIDGANDEIPLDQWAHVAIKKIDGSLVPLRVIAVHPYLGPDAGGGHLYITSSSGDVAGDDSHGTDQLLMSRKGFPEGFNRPNPLDVGGRPEEGVAVDLDHNRVFVTARDVNRLTVIEDTDDHNQLCVETFALDGYIIEPVP